ncbi:MAG: LuxR C-terminal-related transcriptional regulator [Candidatus Gastranaerophilales bacterium]|nr:LuxR C-terminal-related transcriptional regulator [Candidatus Gastranaerophilales bacterium]
MYTNREKEIMFYLEKCCNHAEIAKILGISKHTLKAHISMILRKIKKSELTLEK